MKRISRSPIAFILTVLLGGISGCGYYSKQARMNRRDREFVHGFAEYNVMASEVADSLTKPIFTVPVISPDCYIGSTAEHEFILKTRGLLPTAVPPLDEKMIRNLSSYSRGDEFQMIKSQSIPFFRGGISGIAYWPRVKFGFYDVETGRSGNGISEYRLRQIDTIADGNALVDHADRDHMFYDTYSAAERFAKEHRKGYWNLTIEEQKKADADRVRQKNIQNEIWKQLTRSEWETISVESSKMKKIWTIGNRDEKSFALLAFDAQGQTVEDRYSVELRGVLPTGNAKWDSEARKLLTSRRTHCYVLKDSIERLSDQTIRGIVYYAAYSLAEGNASNADDLSLDTYRTWKPLAVALGYCLVDHTDTAHPLYESLVEAEKLAKRFKLGYWGDDAGKGVKKGSEYQL